MNHTLQTEIKSSIGAHGIWKARLYDAIQKGTAANTVAEVKDDRRCQFGKWLGAADTDTRKSPGYQSCNELHGRFHAAAASVLALALAGKRAEATKAMESGSDYLRVSVDLVRAMMAWARADAEAK